MLAGTELVVANGVLRRSRRGPKEVLEGSFWGPREVRSGSGTLLMDEDRH